MDSCRHLMLTDGSVAREDIATNLSIPLVAAGGFAAVTPAAVAAAARCTRQAVHQWFGGQEPLRRAVAARFTARRSHWLEIRAGLYGLPGLLPECDEVVVWQRVWLAVLELAGRDPEVADCARFGRSREAEAIADLLRRRVRDLTDAPVEIPAVAVTGLHAMVQGFCVELCHPEPGTTFEDGSSVLAAATDRVARQVALARVA